MFSTSFNSRYVSGIIAGALSLWSVPGLSQGLADTGETQAVEIAVEYHPGHGYIRVTEYALRGTASFATLKQLVENTSYCASHFQFKTLKTVEERIISDRGHVTAQCDLFAGSLNPQTVMRDVLSAVLNRHVDVTLSKRNELMVKFQAPESDVRAAGNNARGFYAKDTERMIVWDGPIEKIEVVWQDSVAIDQKSRENDLSTILEHDLMSPEIPEAEVAKIKREFVGSLD